MFKIGEFAQFSRVSIKMLRHYDELGLLKPKHVDPHTNYRYYSADQLPRLNRIIALKDLGFSLGQIAMLLHEDLPPSEIRGMLKLKRMEIQERIEREMARLDQVDTRLDEIERTEDSNPGYEVIIRAVEPMTVAGIHTDPASQAIPQLFDAVETYAAEQGARLFSPPLMIYYAESVEVAVPVKGDTPNPTRQSSICVHPLPGYARVAGVVHTGSYTSLLHASEVLKRWITVHGYRVAGPMREVYLRFGAANSPYTLPAAYLTKNSSEFVTEIQIPIERKTES